MAETECRLRRSDLKARAANVLGPLESKIMAIIWTSGKPLSVRDVVGDLKGQDLAYTTVMTVMSRLAEKGILRRRQAGKAYVYEAKFSEQGMLSRSAQRTVRKLVNDFGEVALAHFAEELDRAKPETLARLRKLRDQPAD